MTRPPLRGPRFQGAWLLAAALGLICAGLIALLALPNPGDDAGQDARSHYTEGDP